MLFEIVRFILTCILICCVKFLGLPKAAEAAASAYYSSNNPHDLFIPSAPQMPPSYDEATVGKQKNS